MKTPNTIIIILLINLLFYSCNKNEFAPEISDQQFTISESSSSGTEVGTVVATDADEGQILSFEIIDGNEEFVFAIEASSGLLSVLDASVLDYESTTQYSLQVVVSDNHKKDPLESSTIITVDVEDENEFAPVINNQSFDLDENPESGLAIGTLQATDEESHQQLNYSMTPRSDSGFVSIEAATGVISVLDPDMFDYETRKSFWIEVVVQDDHEDSMSDTAIITININDALEITDGLVAFYPFNGNADDASGNAIHGQVNGATLTTDRHRNSERAYHFDGIDDYILLNNAYSLHFEDTDFSISVWFEFASMEIKPQEIFSVYSSSGVNRELRFGSNASRDSIHFKLYDNGGAEGDLSYLPRYTGWNHMTVTKNSSEVKFYINGILIAEMPVTASLLHTNAKVLIGAVEKSTTSPDELFNGKIDDIYIHSRVLEDWEVATLYAMK